MKSHSRGPRKSVTLSDWEYKTIIWLLEDAVNCGTINEPASRKLLKRIKSLVPYGYVLDIRLHKPGERVLVYHEVG